MTEWRYLKTVLDQKNLYPQYTENSDMYFIKAFDAGVFIDECIINKHLNLEDKEDFETNYKLLSNANLQKGLLSGNDLSPIGRVSDKLKVYDEDVLAALNTLISEATVSTPSILRNKEVAVTSRTEFDLSDTVYTVPAGKSFVLKSFAGSYDASSSLYIRLKKQSGGSGDFVTVFRMTMMSGGQGDSTLSMNFGEGLNIGVEGDVFKLTIEASIAKGTVWAQFSGSEI